MIFSGCAGNKLQSDGNNEQQGTQNGQSVLRKSPEIEPLNVDVKISFTDVESLDKTKNGYGQGVQVDDQNRTLGALQFNEKYGKYNAKAIADASDKKVLYLTFDQGYENGYTSVILDTLKEKNVKAIFFVLEDYAEKNPELIERMIDEGHVIGNHSKSHYSMPELSGEKCKQEISSLHQYMIENFNYEMSMFRPPMGEFSEYSLAQTQLAGYQTVMWSFAYADWDVNNQPDYETAYEKLVNAIHPGAIYLLHSVSKTNAEVLPAFIDKMHSLGYEFKV
ncbi:MAG: polysaccharide deacetylase [Ruminococcus sp.]|nr:polysaccharide deacetylase [Ruminococcus sp.]